MYRRRPESEILLIRLRLEHEAKSPWVALGFSIFVGTLTAALIFVTGDHVDKPLEASLSTMVKVSLFFDLCIFGIAYASQLRSGKRMFKNDLPWICRDCLETSDHWSKHCTCGGPLEPFEYYQDDPAPGT
jgi:hypothetical protein